MKNLLKKRLDTKERKEGLTIFAVAIIVVLTALWNTYISISIASAFLAILALYKLIKK